MWREREGMGGFPAELEVAAFGLETFGLQGTGARGRGGRGLELLLLLMMMLLLLLTGAFSLLILLLWAEGLAWGIDLRGEKEACFCSPVDKAV
jgi:hypothetical protein